MFIGKYGIQEKPLIAGESDPNISYNYNGDNNALSEGKGSWIYASEYEVFQVIF